MSKAVPVRGLLAFAVIVAIIATYFISPIAEALNTHSADIERSSSQYLSLADSALFDISGNITIEAWVKLESAVPSGSNYGIVTKGDENDVAYAFRIRDVGGGENELDFSYQDGIEYTARSWTANIPVGTWTHVAASVEPASKTINFYVNGAENTGTASGNATSTRNSDVGLSVGNDLWGSGRYLDGLLDDVRVWDVARSAQEIADNYNSELNGNETGLVGYWKLNNFLSDSTSNGNALTNNNGATFVTDFPFGAFIEDLSNRKSTNESVTTSTVLQDDNELVLALAANKTYVVDGVIFASSNSGTPDIKIGFTGQTGVDSTLSYMTDRQNEVLIDSGSSDRIPLQANTPRSIHVAGTVTTSSTSGDFKLKWAQNSSNAAATTVMKGSYLRAQEI